MEHIYTDNIKDEELIIYYQQKNDKRYIAILYKRYAPLVFGLAYKYYLDSQRAEDATTDIFCLVMEKLMHNQISYFKSWLYIVAKNHILSDIRKSKSLIVSSYDEIEEKSPGYFMENMEDDSLNIDLINLPDSHELIKEAIAHLKENQQVCIDLFYIQGKSYYQISDITGYDVKQVKSHIQNGKRNLRIFLESKGYQNGQ